MFLKLSPIAIDISDTSIEMAQVRLLGPKRQIHALSRVVLAEGIIKDGKILNQDLLAQKIKLLFKKSLPRPARGNKIILSIPAKKTFVDLFRVPETLKKEKIESYLRQKSQQKFPVNLEDYSLSYQLVNSHPGYLLAVTSHSLMTSYQKFFLKLGFEVAVIDLEALSLARSLIQQRMKAEEVVLILDIGAQTTEVHIFDHKTLVWTSTLKIGGERFSQDISQKMAVPLKEAETSKRQCGFLPHKKEGRVLNILQASYQPLINHLKQAINYYQTHCQRKVTQIILCGGSALIPGSSEYLSSNLGMEVSLVNPLIKFSLKKWKSDWPPIFFSTALGLCLWQKESLAPFNGFNFLKEKPTQFSGRGLLKKILIFGLSILCLLGLVLFLKRTRHLVIEPQKTESGKTIEFKAVVSLDSLGGDGETNQGAPFQGKLVTVIKETKKDCESSGVLAQPSRAQGKVTLFNNTEETHSLVAQTRLLSEHNKVIFRLPQKIILPANSQIETNVIADKPGEESNIGPSLFVLPGLEKTLQEEIFAQSQAPMTIDVEKTYFFQQTDLDHCQEILQREIINQAKTGLNQQISQEEILMETPIKQAISHQELPILNQEIKIFEASLEAKLSFLALKRQALESVARQKTKEQLNREMADVKGFSFAVDNLDLENQLVYLIIKAEVE